MKVMVFVKATQDSETGVMPGEQLLTEMGQYNEELARAGILLAAEGLHPSSKGVRVHFSGTDRTVIHGPFTIGRLSVTNHLKSVPFQYKLLAHPGY